MRGGLQTTGAAVAAFGAVALILAMLLDWYELDLEAAGDVPTYSAFEGLQRADTALVVAAVVAIGLAAVIVTNVVPDPLLPTGALLAAGGFAVAVVLYRGFNSPPQLIFGAGEVETTLKAGWFLGLAAALVIAAGGLIAFLAARRATTETG